MFKNQHSNYWLGAGRDSNFNLASKGNDHAEVAQLASIKTAITNFVKIVTGRNDIPVTFSSGRQSYTDGDMVVISASTDEKTLDAVVGLALHESTHCVWRDFPDFLKNQLGPCVHVIAPQILLDKVDKLNSTKADDAPEFKVAEVPMLLKTLMNVFEDRRIDWWLYREAPGYRPYYEALYDQYWHSDEIDSALQQGKWDVPIVGNYINQLINMTNPWFDSRSTPGMSEIYRAIDIDNINRFDGDKGWAYARRALPKIAGSRTAEGMPPLKYDLDKMPQIFQLAVEVLGLIFDNAIIANQTSDVAGEDGDESDGSAGQSGGQDDNDGMEDNMDMPDMSSVGVGEGEAGEDNDSDEDSDNDSDDSDDEDSDSDSKGSEGDDSDDDSNEDSEGGDDNSNEKKAAPKPENQKPIDEKSLEEALKKQQQFLDGDVPKEDISPSTDQQITAVQQSGAEEVEVDTGITKTKVLVMNKLTKSIMESGVFAFWDPNGDPYSAEAVKQGFRMGKVLAHKLAIRNQNQTQKFNRRQRGKIDKRRLANLGAGDDSVFYNLRTTAYQPVLAHMSIDASGSMNGQKWTNAMAVGIAVAVAADTIQNLDIVISIRAGGAYGDGASIAIIYDSREDNPSKIRQLFPFITTAGNTPEGLCFAAILDTLVKEKHGDRYFINLSDGEPWFGQYRGSHAYKHTRSQVNHMRAAGMNVLSYFVSSGAPGIETRKAFVTMYGKDASFVDVTKVSSIASTLNKLFLVR